LVYMSNKPAGWLVGPENARFPGKNIFSNRNIFLVLLLTIIDFLKSVYANISCQDLDLVRSSYEESFSAHALFYASVACYVCWSILGAVSCENS